MLNVRMLEEAAGAMGEKVSEMLSLDANSSGTMGKSLDAMKNFESQLGFISNLLEPEAGCRGCIYQDDTALVSGNDGNGGSEEGEDSSTAVDPGLTREERHELAMAQAVVLERDLMAELERRRRDSAKITQLISEMDRINELADQAIRDPPPTSALLNLMSEIEQVQTSSAAVMEEIETADEEAEARMITDWDLPTYEDLFSDSDKENR